jgi:outer membrane protein OmpA-like peptidoglycan-associated protein
VAQAGLVPGLAVPGQPENVVIEGRQGVLRSIYFVSNTAILIETYRPVLETVGRELAADPALQLFMRAYAAPFYTTEGRYMVSENRARFCRAYFLQNYGIAIERINYEAYGSEKLPEHARLSVWETYRCVELILVGN